MPEKKINPSNVVASRFLKEFFEPEYQKSVGILPDINWGKDIKIISGLYKRYCDDSYELLLIVGRKFFESTDNFIITNSYSTSSFCKTFQKIITLFKQQDNIKQVFEGYRLAIFNFNKDIVTTIDNEDIFSQIYLYLKSCYDKNSYGFNFVRFSELFFLSVLDNIKDKNYSISVFNTNFAKLIFQRWLEQNKSDLVFFPKDIGIVDTNIIQAEIENNRKIDIELIRG